VRALRRFDHCGYLEYNRLQKHLNQKLTCAALSAAYEKGMND
jgi:hypothetical protein